VTVRTVSGIVTWSCSRNFPGEANRPLREVIEKSSSIEKKKNFFFWVVVGEREEVKERVTGLNIIKVHYMYV
jgi:hypothetical protein